MFQMIEDGTLIIRGFKEIIRCGWVDWFSISLFSVRLERKGKIFF